MPEKKIQSYRDLLVWQKAMELARTIYQLTNELPKDEQFGLISQMRRSAISIACNIAEGSRRGTRKDFRNFILTAYGSGAELETQLELTTILGLTTRENTEKAEKILNEIMKMLNSFAQKLAS